jgi:hypothetical protein
MFRLGTAAAPARSSAQSPIDGRSGRQREHLGRSVRLCGRAGLSSLPAEAFLRLLQRHGRWRLTARLVVFRRRLLHLLKTREDRRAEAAAEFHKLGLCRRVIFHCPDKHPKSGRIGSWEAHRAVAMHALAHDCRRVLICEDDMLFTRRVGPATLASIERARGAARRLDDLLPRSLAACRLFRASQRAAHLLGLLPCLHREPAPADPWRAPGVEISPIAGRGIDSAYARLPQTYALSRCSRSSGSAGAITSTSSRRGAKGSASSGI